MAAFTIGEISAAMRDPELVRNFTIAANVDAGKSTFSDSMLCYAGLINKDQAGDKTAMDTMKIEQGVLKVEYQFFRQLTPNKEVIG